MSTNDGVTYTLVDETLRHITAKELKIQYVLEVYQKSVLINVLKVNNSVSFKRISIFFDSVSFITTE